MALDFRGTVTGLGDDSCRADRMGLLYVGPSDSAPHNSIQHQRHDIGSSDALQEADRPVDGLFRLHADRHSEIRQLLLDSLHLRWRNDALGVTIEVLCDEIKDLLKLLGSDDRK